MIEINEICLITNAFNITYFSTININKMDTARMKISAALSNKNILVLWTKDGLNTALYYYQDLFYRKENSLIPTENIKDPIYLHIVNDKLEKEIIEIMQNIFIDILKDN